MEIIRDLEALPRNPFPVTAIGNFDGVHLGHRAILKAAIDRARAAGGTAFALTFDPLPAKLLVPARAPRLILTPDDKLELLRLSGIDGVYCVGPLMRHLYERLPAGKGLGWHENPATLEPREIAALLRGGDVVVVKGSKKMFWVNKFVPRLVAALQARAPTG